MVEIFKRSFEDFGIKVLLTQQEWGTLSRNFRHGIYDIVMANWQGFTGPDMLNFVFHSKNIPPMGGNRGHYINPKVDILLDLAEADHVGLAEQDEDLNRLGHVRRFAVGFRPILVRE